MNSSWRHCQTERPEKEKKTMGNRSITRDTALPEYKDASRNNLGSGMEAKETQ